MFRAVEQSQTGLLILTFEIHIADRSGEARNRTGRNFDFNPFGERLADVEILKFTPAQYALSNPLRLDEVFQVVSIQVYPSEQCGLKLVFKPKIPTPLRLRLKVWISKDLIARGWIAEIEI